jgi:hypothetical protein
MSTTPIENVLAVPAFPRDRREKGGYGISDGGISHREPTAGEMISFAVWRKRVVETVVFLAVITLLQRWLFGVAEVPGLPHPYWLVVLPAACQYGIGGGMSAAVVASVMYWFGLPPPSAAQDFYAYAAMVAVQPAVWLATALVLGGLRNLHIRQSTEIADQLADCLRYANDLSAGLERATAEIGALERRIAVDMSSLAGFSRSLSVIDMSDRRAAAASFGELFRIATGMATFSIYLKDREGYVPVWAIEEDTIRSLKSIAPLPSTTVDAMTIENAGREATSVVGEGDPSFGCCAIRVPPSDAGSDPLAVIVCDLDPSQDARQFHRRANELSRALATILYACPNPPLEVRP